LVETTAALPKDHDTDTDDGEALSICRELFGLSLR
jgi:hypothetical protein